MKVHPHLLHAVFCLVVGITTSTFTNINWLAASFWCSAMLLLTGSIAYVEDSMPGGFENPDRSEQPLGIRFAIKSFSITIALAVMALVFKSGLVQMSATSSSKTTTDQKFE